MLLRAIAVIFYGGLPGQTARMGLAANLEQPRVDVIRGCGSYDYF